MTLIVLLYRLTCQTIKWRRYIMHIIFLFLFIGLITLTPSVHRRIQRDCDPNIPSRPVPLTPSFEVDVDGIKPIVCGEGEYLDGFECKPCEDGTFMTPKMAQESKHSFCQKCYEKKMFEIVEEPCTKTRDAKIMCEDGYYRSDVLGKPCQSECRRCDVCGLGINMYKNYEAQACNNYTNTVCCHSDDTVAVNGECILRTTTILTATTTITKDTSTSLSYSFPEVTHSQNNACSSKKTLKQTFLTLLLIVTLVRLTFVSR